MDSSQHTQKAQQHGKHKATHCYIRTTPADYSGFLRDFRF
jgi:hypothetical protein